MVLKIKYLKPGTTFNSGPVAVRILEHFPDGKTLVITNECIADRPFTCQPFKPNQSKDWKANNWRTSTIRAFLNNNFLNSFDEAGGPILSENIIPAEWDLTDNAGNNVYGSTTDKIGLLTEAMFIKYSKQGLLNVDDWWWLITPIAGLSDSVRSVSAGGILTYGSAYRDTGGVWPAFYVKSETEIELEKYKADLSPSAMKPVAVLSTTVLPLDGVYSVVTLSQDEIPDITGVPHYIGHPATKAIVENLGAVQAPTKLFKGLEIGEFALCFSIAQGKSSRAVDGFTSPHQDVDISDLSIRLIVRID